jgi:hypothetical protein
MIIPAGSEAVDRFFPSFGRVFRDVALRARTKTRGANIMSGAAVGAAGRSAAAGQCAGACGIQKQCTAGGVAVTSFIRSAAGHGTRRSFSVASRLAVFRDLFPRRGACYDGPRCVLGSRAPRAGAASALRTILAAYSAACAADE